MTKLTNSAGSLRSLLAEDAVLVVHMLKHSLELAPALWLQIKQSMNINMRTLSVIPEPVFNVSRAETLNCSDTLGDVAKISDIVVGPLGERANTLIPYSLVAAASRCVIWLSAAFEAQ